MTDQERIDHEIVLAGGLKQIARAFTYDDMDMAVWKDQALYLSYFRESGDETKAAMSAGLTPGMVTNWYDEDVLGFKSRQKAASRSLASKIRSTLIEHLLSGKIKTAAAFKLALGDLDPGRYGGEAEDATAAQKLLQEMREFTGAWRKTRAAEKMIDQLEEDMTSEIPEDMDPAELLKLRHRLGE